MIQIGKKSVTTSMNWAKHFSKPMSITHKVIEQRHSLIRCVDEDRLF